jgi:curved DNA-binding protein CbpA
MVAKRDPHVVLGVEPGASPSQVKAAWRKLARAHHPDLIGDDPEASRRATRRMAEINDAYAALTRDGTRRGAGRTGRAAPADVDAMGGRGRGGPPRARPTRPVTGRVDTSETIRPRNAPTSPRGTILAGQPPLRFSAHHREPPRASDPSGPLERGRIRNFRRPKAPPLAEALAVELDFGKFRGHTLGQVAAFEPSYIDWLARTITRDTGLVSAARVVSEDLDRRGIARRAHPATGVDRPTA